jgi:beta-galactosidase
VIDRYASGPLSGRPAVTRRQVGSGGAWYLSTLPDDRLLDALLGDLTAAAGVLPVLADLPPGVEAVRRRSADSSWLFLANDTSETQELPVAGHDLVTDADVDGLQLAPGGVAVIREG